MKKRLFAFVDSFKRQFGAEAKSVARAQAEAATGPVRETWLSILRMLEDGSQARDSRSGEHNRVDFS